MKKLKDGLIDFHVHSSYSDGSENIPSLMKGAKARGVVALALTDHHNANGTQEFMAACKEAGIIGLEGVEIYLRFPETDWSRAAATCGETPDAVILGQRLDWNIFREYQELLRRYREDYWLPAILNGLRSAGLEVPVLDKKEIKNQLKNSAAPAVLHDVIKNPKNWPAILKIVQNYKDVSMDEIAKNPIIYANEYLYAVGKIAYALKVFPEWSVSQAAHLAEKMGGFIFAAHPGGNYGQWSSEHFAYFIHNGGTGIEVWQYYHKKEQMNYFLSLAKEYNLLMSGGSDWHGKNGATQMGCWDKPANQMPVWAANHLLDILF